MALCCLRCCVIHHAIHPLENIMDFNDIDVEEETISEISYCSSTGPGAVGILKGTQSEQPDAANHPKCHAKKTTFREILPLMSGTGSTESNSSFNRMEANSCVSETTLTRDQTEVTPVHAAAVNGDKSSLAKLLIASPRDIDAGDKFGRTPLMYCVLGDRMACAELLIKAGVDINKKDSGGRTNLHWAAHKGNLAFLKLLLSKGANVKDKDNEGQTAMHLCTRHKSHKGLALLMKQLEIGEVDDQDNNKRTALHWAASYGNLEHVKMLIKADSNIGIPDTDGKTPLHWAASSRDQQALDCVVLILETTPSVINWQDYDGRTALHLAVADGNEAIVRVLTSLESCNVSALDNMFRTPLHWGAVLGHSQICGMVLQAKADFLSSDSNGATPLHYAAQNNFNETVDTFLSWPGLKDEADIEGRTAFMWAAGKGANDVIRTFIKHGVDMQQADKNGGTALHAAAMVGHASTVQLLLNHHAPIDMVDLLKHTPLFRACEMGHTDVTQRLIDASAKVDTVDQDGRSPLHWAALGGHAYICQILIKFGVDPNFRDYTGRTPLQCAAYGGFVNCMSVLIEHKADCNAQDNEGMTALHWACSKGHLDAVKLLIEFHAFPNHMEFTEDRYTSVDYALMGEHYDVAQYMIEQGALSITGIQDIAALKIQAVFRGYRVRKTFLERKKLLMKHEQLRKDAAKKKAEEEYKKKDVRHKQEVKERRRQETARSGDSSSDSKELSDPSDGSQSNESSTMIENSDNALMKGDLCDQPLTDCYGLESGDVTSCPMSAATDHKMRVKTLKKKKKVSEVTEEEKILERKKEENAVVTAERKRLLEHRLKDHAARVIQKSWMRWRSLKQGVFRVTEDTIHEKRLQLGEAEWQRQIAALTIQLAWRKYYRKKLMKAFTPHAKKMIQMWDPQVVATKQTALVHNIYGGPLKFRTWSPSGRTIHRPTWYSMLPSPAALSYNFAMDQYQPAKRKHLSSWSHPHHMSTPDDLSKIQMIDSFQPHHFSYNMLDS